MTKIMQKISILILLFSSILTPSVFGFVSPVSVSVVPPLQFPPGDFSVAGIRASALWGRHRDVYGIDLGVIGNITEQTFTGIALAGGFNYTTGNTLALGLQGAGVANVNLEKTKVIGVQLAGIANYNEAESSVSGLQVALIANIAEHTKIRGVQLGLYNKAQTVYGLQVGLINFCENLYGLQIGLANFHSKGIFAVSPILNIGF